MLSAQRKRSLKSQAHQLKPVVMIGNQGLTQNVQDEIHRALEDHELIKIKIAGADRSQRQAIAEEVCNYHQAELIQTMGNMLVIFRVSQKLQQQ